MKIKAMQKSILFLMVGLTFLFFQMSYAANPLPPDKAFHLTTQVTNTDSVTASWDIAPGYYLYRDRFDFKVDGTQNVLLGQINFPQGIEKQDILGKHQIYKNKLIINIPISNPNHGKFTLLVSYQGCSEKGFCYPPVTQRVAIDSDVNPTLTSDKSSQVNPSADKVQISSPSAPISLNPPISDQDHAEKLLTYGYSFLALLAFFGFGVLLAFTPCVLPMLPILSGILVGHGNKINTRKAFTLSLIYVLSMSITFAIAGLVISSLGSNLQIVMQKPWIIVSFSLLFVALACSLFGLYDFSLPQKAQEKVYKLNNQQRAGSYIGAALMGMLSTLIVSPCVSAPLVGALAYIGHTGNVLFGTAALFVMGLGMGVPLLIIGTSFGKWLPKSGVWMNIIKYVFAIMMLGIAIWLLQRVVPEIIASILWSLLYALIAFFLFKSTKSIQSRIWNKVSIACSIAFLFYGLLTMVGAAQGYDSLLTSVSSKKSFDKFNFVTIKELSQVQHFVRVAKLENKPLFIDFYADWCTSCREMDQTVFTDKDVKQALSHYIVLKVDITDNDAKSKELLNHFGVIAPPTFLFFSPQGIEITKARIVGAVKSNQLLLHLKNYE